MGIREAKKKELQEKIELAAKELFLEKDFSEVTMSQIAKRAEVGLGTAYNYYGSKEELFLIAGGTAFIFGKGMKIPEFVDSLEELSEAIAQEIKGLAAIDLLAWRVSLSTLTKVAEKKPNYFLELVQLDRQFLMSVEDVLVKFQKNGQLSVTTNVTTLLDLIYHTLFSSFLLFIYQENPKLELLEQEIKVKLNYLLGC